MSWPSCLTALWRVDRTFWLSTRRVQESYAVVSAFDIAHAAMTCHAVHVCATSRFFQVSTPTSHQSSLLWFSDIKPKSSNRTERHCSGFVMWRVDRWQVDRVTRWPCDELTGSSSGYALKYIAPLFPISTRNLHVSHFGRKRTLTIEMLKVLNDVEIVAAIYTENF